MLKNRKNRFLKNLEIIYIILFSSTIYLKNTSFYIRLYRFICTTPVNGFLKKKTIYIYKEKIDKLSFSLPLQFQKESLLSRMDPQQCPM